MAISQSLRSRSISLDAEQEWNRLEFRHPGPSIRSVAQRLAIHFSRQSRHWTLLDKVSQSKEATCIYIAHIQILCVPVFRSLDAFQPGLNVRGHTRRRNIIIEDIGTLLELAREVGRALGLQHNKCSDGLMLKQPGGVFLTREDPV